LANVHKDFHGCLSFGLKFLEQNFGPSELEEYLRRLARNVYAPLIESLRLRGLPALHDLSDDLLVLEVRTCPAIHHMKERGYKIAEHFCESTRIVNDEICRQAGYSASVEYDQESGRCVQKFRKEAGS
jgi:hypothetical protein